MDREHDDIEQERKDREEKERLELEILRSSDNEERRRIRELVDKMQNQSDKTPVPGEGKTQSKFDLNMGQVNHSPNEEKKDRFQKREPEKEMAYSDMGSAALAGRDRSGELRDPAKVPSGLLQPQINKSRNPGHSDSTPQDKETTHERGPEFDMSYERFPEDPCLMNREELDTYLQQPEEDRNKVKEPDIEPEQEFSLSEPSSDGGGGQEQVQEQEREGGSRRDMLDQEDDATDRRHHKDHTKESAETPDLSKSSSDKSAEAEKTTPEQGETDKDEESEHER
ncbi:MAG: hypothetical protein ACYC69_02895 [Thermodesulfovibrionales bacterium]